MTTSNHDLDLATKPSAPAVELDRFTRAPLQMQLDFHFDAPAEDLWPRVTAPDMIAAWFPTIYAGEVDHGSSSTPGEWGPGSKRYCHAHGMGTLDETILQWDPPRQVVYRVVNRRMPIADHAAVMSLTPDPAGGTRFTWEQYYSPTNPVLGGPFKLMMRAMMRRGLARLRRELGGRGEA